MTIIEIPQGSKEYVKAAMVEDRTLDEQDVEMRIVPGDWVPATWLGSAGASRQVQTTSVVDFAGMDKKYPHDAYVRYTDGSEEIIVHVGQIRVTGLPVPEP